jgi:Rrf2 family protein
MKVSTKGEYGVRALIELAHRYGDARPTQSGEIAARQKVPESYLEQLLTTLRRAGFIRSVRGPQGGHALIRDPREIRVSEVIEALEGPIMPSDCLDETSGCGRGGGGECAQRQMWADVRDAILGVLANTTIAELAERDRAAQPAGARYNI